MAVYLDNTLAIAMRQNESEKTRREEAVRVANSTRQFMHDFHVAQCEANGQEAQTELTPLSQSAEIQGLARQRSDILLAIWAFAPS